MFENSADFFGRIIVYSLDVLGEKASWEKGSYPEHSKGDGMLWYHTSVLPPQELMWMQPFLVWTFLDIFPTSSPRTHKLQPSYWMRGWDGFNCRFNKFLGIIRALETILHIRSISLSTYSLCLEDKAPFHWNTHIKKQTLCNSFFMHNPLICCLYHICFCTLICIQTIAYKWNKCSLLSAIVCASLCHLITDDAWCRFTIKFVRFSSTY